MVCHRTKSIGYFAQLPASNEHSIQNPHHGDYMYAENQGNAFMPHGSSLPCTSPHQSTQHQQEVNQVPRRNIWHTLLVMSMMPLKM